MKFGLLLSGGKDSLYSAYLASKEHKLVCAITIYSENKDSYMFHTPNIKWVGLQTESMGIPLMIAKTKGVKEEELVDLKKAISDAVEQFGIECIVTGAIGSVYQAERIQKICDELGLVCLNPIWQKNQVELLHELVSNKFHVIVGAIAAYGLDKNWIGKELDSKMILKLSELQKKFGLNPAFEGGEVESFVIDCPLFSKKIEIVNSFVEMENEITGRLIIEDAKLVEK
ncbi:MAG: diphthine--ammonia ligase [Candidatus Woesearchaeota archaeon]